jgi:hypothetical protein
MYEYVVGRQINQLFYNKYPIFVETYDYYYTYRNEATWHDLKENVYVGTLKNALVPYNVVDTKMSCERSKHLCILIQHINNAPTLDHELNVSKNFRRYELLNTLYQIYFTLSAIKTQFTHYDLHTDNVLIYTPDETKYIQYHFHTLLGEVISFKSRKVVKIIDYGRSYIETATATTKTNVCAEKACGGPANCGNDYGYSLIPPMNYFIEPWKHNISHDLRLLTIIVNAIHNTARVAPDIPMIMQTELNKIKYSTNYGTKQSLNTGLPARIVNVSDAEVVIRTLLKTPHFKNVNDVYSNAYTKSGDLHVYVDGRNMEYIPVP